MFYYSFIVAPLRALLEGHRAWIYFYCISIVTPFAHICLFTFKQTEQRFSLLLEVSHAIVGILGLLLPVLAIAQMFWTAINSHKLTGDKILRLVFTYIYMLLSFAGLFMVLYFASDFALAQQEIAYKAGSPLPATINQLAFSGVSLRFWSPAELNSVAVPLEKLHFEWRNLHFIYLDMLYFSTVTLTTLGFGDIIPRVPLAKIAVMLEALLGSLLLVLGVASVVPRKDSDS